MNFLSIAVAQTGATKLTPDSNTHRVAAISLRVDCLLTTLVTGAALWNKLNFRTLFSQYLLSSATDSMTKVLKSQEEVK